MTKSNGIHSTPETLRITDLLFPDSASDLSHQSPSNRARHAACLSEDSLFIHGGKSGFRTLNDLWQFNFRTNSWTSSNSFHQISKIKPGLLTEHFMVHYNSLIHLFGNGLNQSNWSEMQVWSYSTGNDWKRCVTPKPSETPSGRQSAKGALIGPKLYIFGGVVDFSLTPTNQLLEFDLDTSCWKHVKIADNSEVPLALYDHSCLAFRSYLYIFGGIGNRRAQQNLWQYNSILCEWKRFDYKVSTPGARHGHGATIAGNSMFIHGGQRDAIYFGDLWQLDLNCKIWTEISLANPIGLSHHILIWLPSENFKAATIVLFPVEEPDWKNQKPDRVNRTISQEKLIVKDGEYNSILRRLSSRRRKTGVANEGIELSDLTEELEIKSSKPSPEKIADERMDIPLVDLTNANNSPVFLRNATNNSPVLSESEKYFMNHPIESTLGKLLIVGGESGQIHRHLRMQEMEIPVNMQL